MHPTASSKYSTSHLIAVQTNGTDASSEIPLCLSAKGPMLAMGSEQHPPGNHANLQ